MLDLQLLKAEFLTTFSMCILFCNSFKDFIGRRLAFLMARHIVRELGDHSPSCT